MNQIAEPAHIAGDVADLLLTHAGRLESGRPINSAAHG
jgi:hypothetical protein